MNIRPAKLVDLELLSVLHRGCFADGWSAASFGELLASPGVFALLSPDGFILLRVAGGEAEILSLGVRASARRSGHALALVTTAAAQAYAGGASSMFLEVGQNNGAAYRLYEKLGFREVGRRKDYYRAPGKPPEDALTLRVELPLLRLGKA